MKSAEKGCMSNYQKSTIGKRDVFGGASLTAAFTYTLLTYSKSLDESDFLKAFLSDAHISIYAGILTYVFTFILSLVSFELSLKLLDWKYNRKIRCLKKLMSQTTNPKVIKSIELKIDNLVHEASKEAVGKQFK
ncbi:hypothetical protein Q4489_09970 [Thalassotalea sp. 1_MG-2023]|uniref:hypothetical protein n=1 Tax=Thalassotalea sp. 1_MG-2023 TaxID=3062680 RepID=UPI0026E18370|nr:hypothetical protein [Thalassotalea sp. 1_MG-2023]MDO6427341.1 hypothetical protein [Thalassotalea sp. 1_MG-2023]